MIKKIISFLLFTLLFSNENKYQIDYSILNDDSRPEQERIQDPYRKALEVYSFLGIKEEMVVADIDPGGGYNTHLLSKIVKNNGKVICILNTHGGGKMPYDLRKIIKKRIKNANLSNVKVYRKINEVPKNLIDVVVCIRNYHDNKPPRDEFLSNLLKIVKPGGIVGIVEVATNKLGWDEETHRLNEKVVIDEFESNGFKLLDKSNILKNYKDDYETSGFDVGRYKMDRYLLKFIKSYD
tara:strand:- start:339 stop:1052 length:714 start_codon:yes stop_codon:yes gene_type:complete